MTKFRLVFKRLLLISVIFGLVAFNIMTLLNEEIHTTAFKALKSVIASVTNDEVLLRVLALSPTITTISSLEKSLEEIKTENAELKKSLQTIRVQRSELEKSYDEIKVQYAKSEEQRIGLEKSSEVLQQLYNQLDQNHNKLQQKSKKRVATANRISKLITLRTERHAIKSASSFFAKIAPIVGAITIATLTSIEIIDDCQTLKELNELNIDFELETTDETTVCGMDMSFLTDYLPD